MNPPVDKHAAARLSFGRKRAAEAGDAAIRTERAVNAVNVTEFALVVKLTEHFHRTLIAVAHADVEHFTLFFGFVCHFHRQRIVYGDGFFAEHVFTRFKRVHSYGVVRVIGR